MSPLLLMPAACAVDGAGYSVGFDGDYYEPYAPAYGGWGGSYAVGPYRRGGFHGDRGGFNHGYRAAGAGRAFPSLPGGGRGIGGRGGGRGGGHGGGHH